MFNSGSPIHVTASNSPLRTLYGSNGNDYLVGVDDNSYTLYEVTGNNTLVGGAGNDKLYGGDGNDRLEGGVGNDILDVGAGNDILIGGAGNDTYIFAPGYGTDTIIDNEGMNTIRFGTGITLEGITATRTNWNDLTLSFEGLDNKLIIQGYHTSENSRNFNLEFANGVKVSAEEFYDMLVNINDVEEENATDISSDNYVVDYVIANSWGDNQTVQITITNTGNEAINGWSLQYDFCGTVTGLWNGEQQGEDVIKSASYNAVITPGASVTFGYTLTNVSSTPTIFNLLS